MVEPAGQSFVQRRPRAPGDQNAGSVIEQELRSREPNSARAARDDGSFSVVLSQLQLVWENDGFFAIVESPAA
jgi:hypothetical protein